MLGPVGLLLCLLLDWMCPIHCPVIVMLVERVVKIQCSISCPNMSLCVILCGEDTFVALLKLFYHFNNDD